MMKITISGQNRRHLKLVEQLAKELGLSISKTAVNTDTETKTQKDKQSDELYNLMKKMADSGAFSSIKDPVAWQREQRKDRPLPGRHEV